MSNMLGLSRVVKIYLAADETARLDEDRREEPL